METVRQQQTVVLEFYGRGGIVSKLEMPIVTLAVVVVGKVENLVILEVVEVVRGRHQDLLVRLSVSLGIHDAMVQAGLPLCLFQMRQQRLPHSLRASRQIRALQHLI
jgi:hypothetical protein